jgi:hypothetical protein
MKKPTILQQLFFRNFKYLCIFEDFNAIFFDFGKCLKHLLVGFGVDFGRFCFALDSAILDFQNIAVLSPFIFTCF